MKKLFFKVAILVLFLFAFSTVFCRNLKATGDGYITFTGFSANDTLTGTAVIYYKPDTSSYLEYYFDHYTTTDRLYVRRNANNTYTVGFGNLYNPTTYTYSGTDISCVVLIYNRGVFYAIHNDTIFSKGTYTTGIDINPTLLRIGNTTSAMDAKLKGRFYDFKYYNNAFDTTYAKYITTSDFPAITQYSDSLVVHYNSDNLSSGDDTIYDLTGHGYHGVITNMIVAPEGHNEQESKSNTALYLKGYQYKVGNVGITNRCNFTYEILLRVDSSATNRAVVGHLAKPGTYYSGFSLAGFTNYYRSYWGDNATTLTSTTDVLGIPNVNHYRQFKHIAVTYDTAKDTAVFYYDGVRIEANYARPTNNTDSIGLGIWSFSYLTTIPANEYGYVRFYTRVLDSTEIRKNATTNYPTNQDSLKAWWWMNSENVSTNLDTIYDLSGRGKHLIKCTNGTSRYLTPATTRINSQ